MQHNITDINREIEKINTNYDLKSLYYHNLQNELKKANNKLILYQNELEYIQIDINATKNAISYNLSDNYISMLLLESQQSTKFNDIQENIDNQKNYINKLESDIYTINMEITFNACYIDELEKKKNRIFRWYNVDSLTEDEKNTEIFKNNYQFLQQLYLINNK